jgi:hypothetical protein
MKKNAIMVDAKKTTSKNLAENHFFLPTKERKKKLGFAEKKLFFYSYSMHFRTFLGLIDKEMFLSIKNKQPFSFNKKHQNWRKSLNFEISEKINHKNHQSLQDLQKT